MALGGEDGSVEVFLTGSLRLVVVIKSFTKLVQSLAWHPPGAHYGQDKETSEKDFWLAAASNECDIHVFDLSKVCREEAGEIKKCEIATSHLFS